MGEGRPDDSGRYIEMSGSSGCFKVSLVLSSVMMGVEKTTTITNDIWERLFALVWRGLSGTDGVMVIREIYAADCVDCAFDRNEYTVKSHDLNFNIWSCDMLTKRTFPHILCPLLGDTRR